jgi:hypothetical protein
MAQFNIRQMPERAEQQLEELGTWTNMTKVQLFLLAIDRLHQEEENRRHVCPDCKQPMDYYPGRPLWVHDDCQFNSPA